MFFRKQHGRCNRCKGKRCVATTLDLLKPGERARIVAVGGDGALRRHLLDMGLTPNTIIMVRKMAPLGDPIEIYLRNFELTLRKEDARQIVIEAVTE
ncbi:MAG TPA: FeoA family protein [Anaerovoracaceae bacterium]|nr:FeoA family protein [Anaerovoracaceae bacterium]